MPIDYLILAFDRDTGEIIANNFQAISESGAFACKALLEEHCPEADVQIFVPLKVN